MRLNTARNYRIGWGRFMQAVARISPGITLAQAQTEMSAIAKRLKAELGDETGMADVALVPLREELVGHVRPALLVLLGDYIDRGLFSLNGVLRTVLQLFVTAPDHVVVLRGNHEYYVEVNGTMYGGVKPVRIDLAHDSDGQLVALQVHPNDWFVRHARRLLQERQAAGTLSPQTVPALAALLNGNVPADRKLRATWTLHSIGALDERQRLSLLDSPHQYVRGWAIQLSLEEAGPSRAILSKLARMAAADPSPVVRLYLASGLQRLPGKSRWQLAAALASHGADAADQNLPLMLWYGIEPMVAADPDRAARLLVECKIPLVRAGRCDIRGDDPRLGPGRYTRVSQPVSREHLAAGSPTSCQASPAGPSALAASRPAVQLSLIPIS